MVEKQSDSMMDSRSDVKMQDTNIRQDTGIANERRIMWPNSLKDLSDCRAMDKKNQTTEPSSDNQLQHVPMQLSAVYEQNQFTKLNTLAELACTICEDMRKANLQLLQELPDHEMYLFNSSRKPNGSLNEFTYFDRLPIELRRMIWRACFPGGRPVYLQRGNFDYDDGRDRFVSQIGAIYDIPQSDCMPPITAFINRESRLETEKCYGMLMQRAEYGFNYVDMNHADHRAWRVETGALWKASDLEHAHIEESPIDQLPTRQELERIPKETLMLVPQRIWFNPEIDTPAIDFFALFYSRNSLFHLADLFRNDPRRAADIRVLNIMHLPVPFDIVPFIEKYGKNVLLIFQGLVELRLVWRPFRAEFEADFTKCELTAPLLKIAMKKVIQQMQRRIPKFVAPAISFYYGKKLVMASHQDSLPAKS